MGFLLTLLYIAVTYFAFGILFPNLGAGRFMLWLAIAAALASIPALLTGRFPYRASQVLLMLGLGVSVVLSHLSHLWLGGALWALQNFLITGIVFFFIVSNITTLARLRVLIIVFVGEMFFLLYRSVAAYYAGNMESGLLLGQGVDVDPVTGNTTGILIRIQAQGILGDPNDFAQGLLTALPFLFLLWRPGRKLRNTLFVILPASFLLYGIYLTHSRGAVIGIGVILLLLCLKRLGKTRSIVASAILIGLIMSPLSGSRDTSLSEGDTAGRIIEWGAGIGMLKSAPIFGVGYGKFLDNGDNITAHNSYVLCFSELGLVGYFFWLGLIVFTVMDLNGAIAALRAKGVSDEWYRYAIVLRLSLFAFLATSWFLSRTYTITLYMVLGMVVAFVHMLNSEKVVESEPPERSRWKLTVGLEFASVLIVYAFVRLRTL
jgi:O-antigen ligase